MRPLFGESHGEATEEMKKRVTTGVGYLGQAALRREQCDMHAVGQESTVETLFITVAKQRNNGSDQRFLWGPFR
jgi:phage-related minor tail protein